MGLKFWEKLVGYDSFKVVALLPVSVARCQCSPGTRFTKPSFKSNFVPRLLAKLKMTGGKTMVHATKYFTNGEVLCDVMPLIFGIKYGCSLYLISENV